MKTIDFSHFIERYNAGEMSDEEKKMVRKGARRQSETAR